VGCWHVHNIGPTVTVSLLLVLRTLLCPDLFDCGGIVIVTVTEM
jgi:hypothetical protein